MKVYLSIISAIVSFVGIAQQNVQYPDFVRAWNTVEVLSNPAASQQDSILFKATIIQKARTGPLKNIGFKLGVGEFFLKKRNGLHSFRGIVFSETEGPYISRPRWYGNYAFQLQLAEVVSVSLGVSYGYVQNKYDAATVLNGNSGVSDGAVGIKLNYKLLEFGASSLQLFNNSIVTGEKVTLELARYYTFTGVYQIPISSQFSIHPSVYYRFLPYGVNDVLLTTELVYDERFSFGVIEEIRKGVAFFLQANDLMYDVPLTVLLLYRTTMFSNVPAQFNHFEIGLGYSINR